jgi:hypothetical protein
MPRRLNSQLRRVLHRRRTRGASASDGPGYIYVFDDSGVIKIGSTNNMRRREREWNRSCHHPGRVWIESFHTSNRRFAGEYLFQLNRCTLTGFSESIIHLRLESVCVDRPRLHCVTCKYQPVLLYPPTDGYRRTKTYREIRFRDGGVDAHDSANHFEIIVIVVVVVIVV